mmetsp:Transcript_10531/g.29516  ORF Transcript_10531/g.29516 Transcript_10531/m.29516 type:complete len:289 (-) Transcript_10531:1206-2072(-)
MHCGPCVVPIALASARTRGALHLGRLRQTPLCQLAFQLSDGGLAILHGPPQACQFSPVALGLLLQVGLHGHELSVGRRSHLSLIFQVCNRCGQALGLPESVLELGLQLVGSVLQALNLRPELLFFLLEVLLHQLELLTPLLCTLLKGLEVRFPLLEHSAELRQLRVFLPQDSAQFSHHGLQPSGFGQLVLQALLPFQGCLSLLQALLELSNLLLQGSLHFPELALENFAGLERSGLCLLLCLVHSFLHPAFDVLLMTFAHGGQLLPFRFESLPLTLQLVLVDLDLILR